MPFMKEFVTKIYFSVSIYSNLFFFKEIVNLIFN